MNVILLAASIVTCLALGVGLAYGLCNLMFINLRSRRSKPALVSEVAGIAPV